MAAESVTKRSVTDTDVSPNVFYLPLFHRLQGQPCLVIGGGQTALRKLRWLVRAGAQITVIAPEIDPQIQRMRDAGELVVSARILCRSDQSPAAIGD